ncbi:hypothetical protein DSO57_1018091 [Entomophthora muscae]|uniref:Uncharacterized protein n=1 Tax=Entomophthora muscae TaxID=34485 RepID=A0ACC2RVI1_9FUNG|nr:hypothetical protein DSO57_1018091 [Entomophthora muscae]
MASDRYRIVVHGKGVPCLLSWLLIVILCFMVLAIKIANTALHGLRPDPTMTYCQTFGVGALTKTSQYFSILIITVGVILITFSYVSIYLTCRKNPFVKSALPDRYLIILFAYHICLLPKFLTSIWKLFAEKSTIPDCLFILAASGFELLYVVNPCLVFAFQSNLRKGLYQMFLSNTTLP